MEHLKVFTTVASDANLDEMIKDVPVFLEQFSKKFRESFPDDMKIAMAAGVPIKIDAEFKDGSVTVSARTEYPVSILKTPQGLAVSIIVDRGQIKRLPPYLGGTSPGTD